MLDTFGRHPRVIAFKGLTEHGLLLERAQNENVYERVNGASGVVVLRSGRNCVGADKLLKRFVSCIRNISSTAISTFGISS